MASGVFCVTGPRHFALGVQLGAEDGREGVILDVQVGMRRNPLAQGVIGGTTRGLPERLLQGRQHAWRE
jgi:hypothetical protein